MDMSGLDEQHSIRDVDFTHDPDFAGGRDNRDRDYVAFGNVRLDLDTGNVIDRPRHVAGFALPPPAARIVFAAASTPWISP